MINQANDRELLMVLRDLNTILLIGLISDGMPKAEVMEHLLKKYKVQDLVDKLGDVIDE